MRLENEAEEAEAEAEAEDERKGEVREREEEVEGKAGSPASKTVADETKAASWAVDKLRSRSNKNWGSERTACKISSKSAWDCGLNCKKKSGERPTTETSTSDKPSSSNGS